MMLKKLSTLLFMLPTLLFAQNFDLESLDMDKPLTSNVVGKSVMVIPFNTDLFNNQEAEYIVPASQMEYEQTINYMKTSLDSAIIRSLRDTCKVVSMLTGFAQSTSSDLEKIHQAAIYYMTDRPALVESKSRNNLFTNTKKQPKPVQQSGIVNGEIVTTREDLSNKFMAVKFDDKEFINSMSIKYGVKYLLFITQFDIVGDYSNPYQVAQRTYDRIIKVHYCVYDNEGNYIDGNLLTHTFSAQEDNVVDICRNNFDALATKIVKKLPY